MLLVFAPSTWANTTGFSRLRPLIFGVQECERIEVEAVPFDEELEVKLAELSDYEMELLNTKRQEVLTGIFELLEPKLTKIGYLTGPIACLKRNGESPRAVGIRKLADKMDGLDKYMLENMKLVSKCTRWGVCGGLDIHMSIGFLKYYKVRGGMLSWDVTTKFGENSWEVNRYADFIRRGESITPMILGSIGVYSFVHFDSPVQTEVREFTANYLPVVLMKVSGENSRGYGLKTGAAFPPVISSGYIYDHVVERHPYQKVKNKCARWLSGLIGRNGPEEYPAE